MLAQIDNYYEDQHGGWRRCRLAAGARQLSKPQPADRSVIGQLSSYRRLRKRWSDWSAVDARSSMKSPTRMIESNEPLSFRNVNVVSR